MEPKTCVIPYILKMHIGPIYIRYQGKWLGEREKIAYHYFQMAIAIASEGANHKHQ